MRASAGPCAFSCWLTTPIVAGADGRSKPGLPPAAGEAIRATTGLRQGSPLPAPDPPPLARYLAYRERAHLAYHYSPTCDRPVFYPRLLCPYTGSDLLEWRVSAGLGPVCSTTVVHPPQ